MNRSIRHQHRQKTPCHCCRMLFRNRIALSNHNTFGVHSAIADITPADKRPGLEQVLFQDRDRTRKEARRQCRVVRPPVGLHTEVAGWLPTGDNLDRLGRSRAVTVTRPQSGAAPPMRCVKAWVCNQTAEGCPRTWGERDDEDDGRPHTSFQVRSRGVRHSHGGSDMHQAGRSSSEVLWHRSRNRGLQPCRTRLFTFGHGRPLTTNLFEIDFAAFGHQQRLDVGLVLRSKRDHLGQYQPLDCHYPNLMSCRPCQR